MRGKLVFFRHQGRKWRNIPMVNVMCLETTIWNFIEIREICDGSAAPALHITQPTRSKKLGQLNFQNSFFLPSLCGYHVSVSLRSRQTWAAGVLWKLILTNHHRHSQPPPACAWLFTSPAPAQAGPYNIYQGPGLAFRNWVSLSQCQSVSSLYLYFSCSNFFLLNTLLNQNYSNLPAIVIFRSSMFHV